MILTKAKFTISGVLVLALGWGGGVPAFAYFTDLFPRGSDPRTAAMGEITFAAPGEKNELNLFNLGNPCGAVFLPEKSRLDYGLFRDESDAWPSNTHLDLGGTGGAYQGVLLRPDAHTAVQVGTTAKAYTHTYGDSLFYEGQRVHALAAGSLVGAYEVLPGLGMGVKYRYARPVQEVYWENKMQEENSADLGLGYRLGDELTLGLNAGYAVTHQNQGDAPSEYYSRWQISDASSVVVSESWSVYHSTLERSVYQPHASFQVLYQPIPALSVACWGEYQHEFWLDRIQTRSSSTQRLSGTGSPISDYTEHSSSAALTQGEYSSDSYTLRPVIALSLGVSDETRLDLGVHAQYEGSVATQKYYGVSADPTITTRTYDNGVITQVSTQPPLEAPFGFTRQTEDYNYALGTLSWHSTTKGFLLGGQYEYQKNRTVISVGGEYWLLPALAVRAGAQVYASSYAQSNIYTSGLGWEGEGYALDFAYQWSRLEVQSYEQMMALGVTVYL